MADHADGVYTVRSTRVEATEYTVRLSSEVDDTIPWCDCVDWQRHYLPCKHLLAVIMTRAPHGWNSLPESYRNFPQFCLDPEIAPTSTTAEVSGSFPGSAPETLDADDGSVLEEPRPGLSDMSEIVSGSVAEVSVSSPGSTAATLDSAHVSVVEEPTPGMSDMSSVADMQSKVRQALSVLCNLTYNVGDLGFLQQSLSVFDAQVHEFKSRARLSLSSRRFHIAHKLVKSSIIASGLRRRMAAVRSKRRSRKQSRMLHTAGMQRFDDFQRYMHCTVFAMFRNVYFGFFVIRTLWLFLPLHLNVYHDIALAVIYVVYCDSD